MTDSRRDESGKLILKLHRNSAINWEKAGVLLMEPNIIFVQASSYMMEDRVGERMLYLEINSYFGGFLMETNGPEMSRWKK